MRIGLKNDAYWLSHGVKSVKVSLRIQSEGEKILTRNKFLFGHFSQSVARLKLRNPCHYLNI